MTGTAIARKPVAVIPKAGAELPSENVATAEVGRPKTNPTVPVEVDQDWRRSFGSCGPPESDFGSGRQFRTERARTIPTPPDSQRPPLDVGQNQPTVFFFVADARCPIFRPVEIRNPSSSISDYCQRRAMLYGDPMVRAARAGTAFCEPSRSSNGKSPRRSRARKLRPWEIAAAGVANRRRFDPELKSCQGHRMFGGSASRRDQAHFREISGSDNDFHGRADTDPGSIIAGATDRRLLDPTARPHLIRRPIARLGRGHSGFFARHAHAPRADREFPRAATNKAKARRRPLRLE